MHLYRLIFVHILLEFCWADENSFNSITEDDVESALRRAQVKVKEIERLEKELIAKGQYLNRSIISAEARHQLRGGHLGLRVDKWAQKILEIATADLASRFGLNGEELEKLSKIPLNGEIGRQVSQQCNDQRPTNCNPNAIYRNIDGSCNNLQWPNEGRIFSCLQRLLPSDYEDGISAPRSEGNTLPNPRQVSIALHRIVPANREINESRLSAWHMSFGQFLDHDMEFTTQPTTANNTAITCCPGTHQACFPIQLSNDPDFSGTCMNFVRDMPCIHCSLGKREQMNSLTTLIDCSQVYGTTDDQAQSLRTTNGDGKLLTRIINGVGERPPPSNNTQQDQCSRPNFPCFTFGDFRGNQNPLLSAHQITFLLYHNYLVDQFTRINPHWNGEKKYQEARRLMIACFQHIVYDEYLPLVIENEALETFYLKSIDTRFNSKVIALIINAFAAAVFRFGHSTVVDFFLTLSETNQRGRLEFKDSFFNPIPFYQQNGLENLVRGSTRQPQQKFDNYAVRAVTQFLYQRLNVTNTLDLASINIQRGRDHGLPGYTKYVERVHNFVINSFDDLKNKGLLSTNCINAGIYDLYRSVHDVDLWTGLLCEPRDGYALVGPTAEYLIGHQFHLLKFGDRRFYTHQQLEPGSFTSAQRTSIGKMLFARIICDVLRFKSISEAVFEYTSLIVSCSDYGRIPQLDFDLWKETPSSGK